MKMNKLFLSLALLASVCGVKAMDSAKTANVPCVFFTSMNGKVSGSLSNLLNAKTDLEFVVTSLSSLSKTIDVADLVKANQAKLKTINAALLALGVKVSRTSGSSTPPSPAREFCETFADYTPPMSPIADTPGKGDVSTAKSTVKFPKARWDKQTQNANLQITASVFIQRGHPEWAKTLAPLREAVKVAKDAYLTKDPVAKTDAKLKNLRISIANLWGKCGELIGSRFVS